MSLYNTHTSTYGGGSDTVTPVVTMLAASMRAGSSATVAASRPYMLDTCRCDASIDAGGRGTATGEAGGAPPGKHEGRAQTKAAWIM